MLCKAVGAKHCNIMYYSLDAKIENSMNGTCNEFNRCLPFYSKHYAKVSTNIRT